MPTDKNKDVSGAGELFKDDPLRYCQRIYDESVKRLDDLMDENAENRLFYEGKDPQLDARKKETRVERSAIFVPLVKPAIDTRMSSINARLGSREFPVSIRTTEEAPDVELDTQAMYIERIINEQLRDCGYLPDGFMEHCTAAEMYRMAVVKVGWESHWESVPTIEQPKNVLEKVQSFFGKKEVGKPTVKFVRKERGRPYVEYLDPDAFLYQPNQSNFERMEYCGHRVWCDLDEIRRLAEEYGWDAAKIDEYEHGTGSTEGGSAPHSQEAFRDTIESEKGTPYDNGMRDGKHLLVEWYISAYNDKGQEEIKQVMVLANNYILKTRTSPCKGIRFPFVQAVANPLPGTIEGLPSVEMGKAFQRLYNETFNSYLDGVTYRIFPPFIVEAGFKFEETPVYGPARLWRTATMDGIRPLIENPGQLPDLPSLMASIADSHRNMMNANDLEQGMNANPYEKATAAKLRTAGSTQRASAMQKRYGLVLAKVARMFLALNQQYNENGPLFVADVVIDVPSLTNASDDEAEKQEALLLLAQAMQNPLYQNPIGMTKIRNLMEDVILKFKKTDVARYIMTAQELEQVTMQNAQMQEAVMEKQGMMEQFAMQSQASQQMMEQENGVSQQ